MKFSFGISDFLEEILSLSHSVVFLYFFALLVRYIYTRKCQFLGISTIEIPNLKGFS